MSVESNEGSYQKAPSFYGLDREGGIVEPIGRMGFWVEGGRDMVRAIWEETFREKRFQLEKSKQLAAFYLAMAGVLLFRGSERIMDGLKRIPGLSSIK